MNHDLLNDEHLSIVNGGARGDGTGTCGGKRNGTGGGDSLGWLRHLVSSIAHAFGF